MASEQTVELPRPELSAAKRALIEARLRGKVRASGIVPRPHGENAPLSFAQERLWFIDRLQPGSATYNMPVARRMAGALDQAALERALGEIVRRHEALRTTFREVDGSPVQVIAPFGGFTLRLDDLSGLADAAREVEVRRRATEEAMRPFDLTAGPLFRTRLLRLGVLDLPGIPPSANESHLQGGVPLSELLDDQSVAVLAVRRQHETFWIHRLADVEDDTERSVVTRARSQLANDALGRCLGYNAGIGLGHAGQAAGRPARAARAASPPTGPAPSRSTRGRSRR